MSRLRVDFEVADGQRLKLMFDNLAHKVDDFREPFEKMAEDFWHEEDRTFASEGPGWAPLTPRYKARKERKHPGMPILVRSGALKESLTSGTADGSVYEVYPDHMVLGTSLSVGKWNLGALHQFGTRKMPARPPIKLTQSLQRRWENRMATWLREEFGYEG